MNPSDKQSIDPELSNRPQPWAFNALISFAAGLAVALVLHYILYRIGIPGEPFIYAVF